MLCEGVSHGDHVHGGNELHFAAPLLAGAAPIARDGGGSLTLLLPGILLFFLSENLVSKLNPSPAACGHSHSLPPPKSPRSASPSKSSTSTTAAAANGHESQSRAKVILLVLADLLHNFTDGLALGVSWSSSRDFLRFYSGFIFAH
jgi:zinc transporter ZupT